jgi:UDPglucose 6-dehydrogenase|tara:strand:+ start:122 stop:1363 length:1242 start_codon:yes stop_codon:yes gene_type:complete
MNIGFIGLGKLGLPVALAVESKGHTIFGYDISDEVKTIIDAKKIPYKEIWAQKYLENSKLKFSSIENVVKNSEIIFVPIQTPHDELFEGVTKIPDNRKDFDYKYLVNGIKILSVEIEKQKKPKIVIIISTVLPGTIRREIFPLLGPNTKLCYNPFFIAMGTTIKDFLYPEFILFGVQDLEASNKAEKFYRTIHNAPFFKTTIENAELIKVVYNTFISTKIGFINTVMEMCHHLPNTNVDDITNALKLATKRIISDKYLYGGMGDGGGCHPRDNIALSWLAKKLNLSTDWFENIMIQREKQTIWLRDLIIKNLVNDKVYVLGRSFKPETNIETGSSSKLLINLLLEKKLDVESFDPYIDVKKIDFIKGTYFIGTKHSDFENFNFPKGSVVIDPFRFITKKKSEVKYISLGNNLE